jgi:DNA-3-methyladenine glycosylase I
VRGEDGVLRCAWAGSTSEYRAYHDTEWGYPVSDDVRLFEKLSLEGFQSGLSWITILRKREAFRRAFAGFELERVARFTERDVVRLLGDASIIRHRGKIEAVINNAARAVELAAEHGSLAAYVWAYEPKRRRRARRVSESPESQALARDLRRRGWRFVGPTTAYAFMQATGLVNDHAPRCATGPAVEQARGAFLPPGRGRAPRRSRRARESAICIQHLLHRRSAEPGERVELAREPLELAGGVQVDELTLVELQHGAVHTAERELAGGEAALELGEHRLRVRARERARLGHGGRGAEGAHGGGGEQRTVDRDDHRGRIRGRPEARDDAGDRRPDVGAVVEHRERQRQLVGGLADGDPLTARGAEHAPHAFRERLGAEARERLRRPEPAARAADEQDARQPSIRHGAV